MTLRNFFVETSASALKLVRLLPVNVVVFLCLMPPFTTYAAVLINEVAWMGTATNVNDEWLELYNDGDSMVALDGWTLDDGVSLTISLTGTLGAHEYAVLERTDDDTVPGVAAFLIYTGALANDGRTLSLKRDDGSLEDRVVGGENWTNIGGDNVTKDTAQRTTSGWTTVAPTPGAQNTDRGRSDEDSSSDTNTATKTTTTKSGGTGASVAKKQTAPKAVAEPSLSIRGPRTVYVNQPAVFEAVPDGMGDVIVNSLVYAWNFGDTYTDGGKKPTHTFLYPGEYVVFVEGKFGERIVRARQEVTVLPVSLKVTVTPAGDVQITNDAPTEIDLGGFTLQGDSRFVFPGNTFLKPRTTLTFSGSRVGLTMRTVLLFDPAGVVAASYVERPPQALASISQASYPLPRPTSPVVVSKTTPTPESIPVVVLTPSATQTIPTEPTETVIRIGAEKDAASSNPGFLKRVFAKLASIIGL